MKHTLYSLIVDNNTSNDKINHLYTFFSTLWQEKYVKDRKEEHMKAMSNAFTNLVLDYLKGRLELMDSINRKLAILVKRDILHNRYMVASK